MALSEKNRSKAAARAEALLPPGTHLRSYVVGRAHARVTAGVGVVLGVFGVVFVGALLLGRILIPGGLLVFLVFNMIRPPRALVVTGQGVSLLSRSIWTGRPSGVLGSFPLGPVTVPGSGSVTLAMGGERVTFSRTEALRLVAAVGVA